VTNGALYIRSWSASHTFSAPYEADAPPLGDPVVADVNGDGTSDVLVVNASGMIRYRQGVPGQPGSFEPPLTVNPGNPSRDIVWVPDTLDGPLLASVDALDDKVSLFAYRKGKFTMVGSLATGQLPAQIIAVDLDDRGWDDLIVRNAGNGTISIFLNNQLGIFETGFAAPFLLASTISVGTGVSDVQAIDTTGDGRLDLVVTNQLTGQLSVVLNEGVDHFGTPVSFRAGTSLPGVEPGGTRDVSSLEVTAGVAGGHLGPGGPIGLVTINPGTNTIDLLKVLGDGQLSNPVSAPPVPIPNQSPPQFLRVAEFTADGDLDLAVLTLTGLSIYLGNGQGSFVFNHTYPVPSTADGLTIADLSGNGKLDVVVGDAYGDVLVLVVNGNRTFQPYRKSDQSVLLAVADLSGDGSNDFIYADQGRNQVSVQYGGSASPSVLADQSQDLIQPGAVALADLNGDGILDLIVADSGGDNVLIYPGLGNGQFGTAINNGYGYFVGTNSVGITVADLRGSLPDLVVADEGSNEVSILLNTSVPGGPISFSPGQRLSSGGIGPVSTVVETSASSPYPYIMVTNSGSNNVVMLQGVQPGYFGDQDPRYFAVGIAPTNSFVGNFNGQTDLVTIDAGSNQVTVTSDFEGSNPLVSTLSSGGVDPTAAFDFSTTGGFEDLVVANSGDGVLALFDGGPQGLVMANSESEQGLPAPTVMSFAALTSGAVELYAATAGPEAADLVTLSLSIAGETTSGRSDFSGAAPVQLVSLNGSSLPLLATVLTLTPNVSSDASLASPSESEAAGLVASVAGAATSAGQGPYSAMRRGASSPETPDEPGAVGMPVPAVLSPWERFLLGLDEALEALERRGSDEMPAPSAPTDPRDAPPKPTAPANGESVRRSAADRPSDDGGDGIDLSEASPLRSSVETH
jgi:hypothetical protein